MQRIRIVDTHTGGEPTRVVVSSPIVFSGSSLSERRAQFASQYDGYRRAICCEPRGSDVMVGALLTDAEHTSSVAGVIFFNNVGYLGMCGHGAIGVVAALRHLGRIDVGTHRIDTPVGTVPFDLDSDGRVSLLNVPSDRYRAHVPLTLSTGQVVHGDIAWGGNWFFICEDHGQTLELANLPALDAVARDIRNALTVAAITGRDEAIIDHVELIGPPSSSAVADAKNFVLCPGGAYDRSPCGTGTSAKVACLAADGKLKAGEVFRQESIIGSIFEAKYSPLPDKRIQPTIMGEAHVNAEGELLLDPSDPFCMGIQL
jgi:4-hydroxyproline epimerase